MIAFWEGAHAVHPDQFSYRTRGAWWEAVERAGRTLFVSREYEHLVLAISLKAGRPHLSHLRVPHPSGMAWDAERRRLHVACTRNPNQLLTLSPLAETESPVTDRLNCSLDRPLMPATLRYLPGSLYLHDLAMIGRRLYGNAVGMNAVVRLDAGNATTPEWWPKCIEKAGRPDFSANFLQLNSIAAGPSLAGSYFSASATSVSRRRPGHLNFPVKERGAIFSGRTREPVATGLTRPHSARIHRNTIWVDNSGYGELGIVGQDGYAPVLQLPGWTRGLHFVDDLAFVGTSRVIPRFRHYAPGLDVDRSECGIHAVEVSTGRVLGSMIWPSGNQIFAIESAPSEETLGFPFTSRRSPKGGSIRELFFRGSAEQ